MSWWVVLAAVLLLTWWVIAAQMYKSIWHRPLKLRWWWTAPGSLLSARRTPNLEVKP